MSDASHDLEVMVTTIARDNMFRWETTKKKKKKLKQNILT